MSLAWRPLKAPSLEEIHVIAEEAYRRLPQKFKMLCQGLVIHVEDFPTDEVLDELEAETEFDLPLRSQAIHARAIADAERLVIQARRAVDGAAPRAEQNAVHGIGGQVEVAEVRQVKERHARLDRDPFFKRVPPCQP